MQQIGPYRVVRPLAQGGMGSVFEVVGPGGGSLALKLVPLRAAKAQERFRREAEMLARVRHPNVVVVHDVGFGSGGNYLVTDLVAGRSLEQVMGEGALDPPDAARIVRDLAAAVCAVHAAGILHRDIKPANVILRADGQPVLLDFGVARDETAESLTQSGQMVGTPGFMSPEQVTGERDRQGHATDVYGLGAVLYALVCGHAPFHHHTTMVDMLTAVVDAEPTWPSAEGVAIPARLEAICRKAMAKRPEDRYAAPVDLIDALDAFLAAPEAAAGGGRLVAGLAVAIALLVAGLGLALAGRGAPEGETAAKTEATTTSAKTAAAKTGPSPVAEPSPSPTPGPKRKAEAEQALARIRKTRLAGKVDRKQQLVALDAWGAEYGRAFPALAASREATWLARGLRLEVALRDADTTRSMIGWGRVRRVVGLGERLLFATARGAFLLTGAKSWAVMTLKPTVDVGLVGERALVLRTTRLELRKFDPSDSPLTAATFRGKPRRLAWTAGRAAIGFASGAITVFAIEGDRLRRTGSWTPGHGVPIMGLAFTPDGKTLVSVGRTALRVWDVASGTVRTSVTLPGPASAVAIADGGAHCLVGIAQPEQLRTYALQDGAELRLEDEDVNPGGLPADLELDGQGRLFCLAVGTRGRVIMAYEIDAQGRVGRPLAALAFGQPSEDLAVYGATPTLAACGAKNSVWRWKVPDAPAWPDAVRTRWR